MVHVLARLAGYRSMGDPGKETVKNQYMVADAETLLKLEATMPTIEIDQILADLLTSTVAIASVQQPKQGRCPGHVPTFRYALPVGLAMCLECQQMIAATGLGVTRGRTPR
jgi:hypothetical protein